MARIKLHPVTKLELLAFYLHRPHIGTYISYFGTLLHGLGDIQKNNTQEAGRIHDEPIKFH